MSVNPTSIVYEMQFGGTAGAWTDVTEDIVTSVGVQAGYGIRGNGPIDRVATSGYLTFSLDNSASNSLGREGAYTPSGGYTIPGFQAGITVRVRITYNDTTYTKFYGRIVPDGIQVESGQLSSRRTHVTARDFMEQAAIHELTLPEFTTDKRINEVVPLIVSNMPIPPKATSYGTGQDVFNTVFDTVRSKTRAISEFTKLAWSELGFIYNKFDKTNDETLVVEGRYTRNDVTTLTQLPVGLSASEYLLMESGDFLLQENGSKIITQNIAGTIPASFNNTFVEMQTSNGKYIYNKIKTVAYPRYTDTSAAVLATLQKPILLAAGATQENIFLRYRDPEGGNANVSGRDMEVPAGTTDYLMNANATGTGADLTEYLNVTADYGTEGVNYTLENSGTVSAGYVTKLQARGLGIYIYDPVELLDEDTTSENIHGSRTLSIDMKYQDDPLTAGDFTGLLKAQYKDPRTIVDKVTFYANRSETNMIAFLECEPGSKIHLTEPVAGIDLDYFINGVEYEIVQGDIIRFTWYPKPASEDTFILWYLGTSGYSELDTTTVLGY